MARVCDLCGKGPQFGHKISHAHNVSNRRWNVNIQSVRAIVNGALAMGRLVGGSQQNKMMETAINSMQMSGTGKTVALSFSVSPELLDMLNGVAGLKNLANMPKGVIKK